MKQAITTKYIGPTNSRGARVKATCDGGSVTIPWDHALDSEHNHINAAETLFEKLGWNQRNRLVGGGTKNGYVFVQVTK